MRGTHTHQMSPRGLERNERTNRVGVFIGSYVNPALKARIDEITNATLHKNRSYMIAELLTEAIDERDRKAAEGK